MKNSDDQAFPLDQISPGLTKREYFAGLAIQGLLANQEIRYDHAAQLVKDAINTADALLEALELPTRAIDAATLEK
jgi:hypothetical protein